MINLINKIALLEENDISNIFRKFITFINKFFRCIFKKKIIL